MLLCFSTSCCYLKCKHSYQSKEASCNDFQAQKENSFPKICAMFFHISLGCSGYNPQGWWCAIQLTPQKAHIDHLKKESSDFSYELKTSEEKNNNETLTEPFTEKNRVALDEKLRHSMFKLWNLENCTCTSVSLPFQVLLGQQKLSSL